MRNYDRLLSLLVLALCVAPELAFAQGAPDKQLVFGLCKVVALTSGSFGAILTTVAGLIAIVSAALGGYRVAISVIVVGAGTYVIPPMVDLFFGMANCGSGTFIRNLPL